MSLGKVGGWVGGWVYLVFVQDVGVEFLVFSFVALGDFGQIADVQVGKAGGLLVWVGGWVGGWGWGWVGDRWVEED